MTRRDAERLADILAAIEAIEAHLTRGGLGDGLVFDAVRLRLIEIGEAVRTISPELLATESEIPWAQVGAMRNYITHQYFDTTRDIVSATVSQDLPELRQAVQRLIERRSGSSDQPGQ